MDDRRILFVDDEENVLQAFRRILHNKFNCSYSHDPKHVIDILGKGEPFAVIIVDMNMPEMNGIDLLKIVKDEFPDIVRVMLTGNADMITAINAVNDGQIFRFLTKPCPNEILIKTIKSAIDQYGLVVAERELLEKTLKGSVNTIVEMLSLVNPKVFSIQNQIKKLSMKLVEKSGFKEKWKYEIAFLLSQIGMFSLPEELTDKIYANSPLTLEEKQIFAQHPLIGKKIINNIPRLQQVAAIIGGQLKNYSEYNHEKEIFNDIFMGAQILKVVTDFVYLINSGFSKDAVISRMSDNKDKYNTYFLEKLANITIEKQATVYKTLLVREMIPGMILDEDIKARNGLIVIKKNQEVTLNILETLKSFNEGIGLEEPIRVVVSL